MSGGVQLFVTALGFGAVYNAAPGAVNTEALRRGLSDGFRPALAVQLGALVGDSAWAALALTGTALFVSNRSARLLLGVVGACFLLRLAWQSLRQAWTGRPDAARVTASEVEAAAIAQAQRRARHGFAWRGDFATGAFFSLANPFALAFWSGIGGGLTAGVSGSSGNSVGVLLAGFICGALAWCLCIPVVIGWSRRFVRPAVFRWINALCGLALAYFGLDLLAGTARSVMGHPLASAPIPLPVVVKVAK